MTPSLPTPTSLPTPLAPHTEARDTNAPDTKALATTKPETDWEREVWKWVEPEFKELTKKAPLSKAEGACGVICHPWTEAHTKEFTRCLTEHGEYRNVVSNVCDTPPAMTSVPGDSILVETLPDMAAFRFYKDGKPCAPTMWPKDSNIPVALYRCEMPKSGEAERFGKDSVVHASWWAFAQAVKAHKAATAAKPQNSADIAETSKCLDGFRKLARNCLFDYKLFHDKEARDLAAFQELENIEEAREKFGFTGSHKIRLIVWAEETVRAKNGGKDVDDEAISQYLRKNIKWTDEKTAPSKHVVNHLRTIAKAIKKQPDILKATQLAEAKFGRATLFDEYSKFLILIQRSRSSGDTLWLVRSFVADMLRQEKARIKTGQPTIKPDVCSQGDLRSKTGMVAVYQKIKDCLAWLGQKYPCEIDDPTGRWASLQDPLTAVQVDDGDFTWMRTWTECQRRSYNMQKKLMEAGPEVRSVLKGLLATPPATVLILSSTSCSPS